MDGYYDDPWINGFSGMLFPVVEVGGRELIYVGERGTSPENRRYGPIAGKTKATEGGFNYPWFEPNRTVDPRPGARVLSEEDARAVRAGREMAGATAAREFWEECFKDVEFRPEYVTDLVRLGYVEDMVGGVKHGPSVFTWKDGVIFRNLIHLARVHRSDFVLEEREIISLKPLEELLPGDVLQPLAKIALYGLRHALLDIQSGAMEPSSTLFEPLRPYIGLESQIPDWSDKEMCEYAQYLPTDIHRARRLNEMAWNRFDTVEEFEAALRQAYSEGRLCPERRVSPNEITPPPRPLNAIEMQALTYLMYPDIVGHI
jgi:hypothetical protein